MHNNLASVTWHNTQWIPVLNASNVIEYFMDLSNPFYDKTCNNEIMKMQRLSLDQLSNMSGPEYIVLHAQEPILYVIRKQHRHSPTQVTPLADYYIVAGIVYQAPDLGAVINSRILTAVSHLESSFNEAHSFSRYQPSKGYSWEFKEKSAEKEKVRKKAKPEEESTSLQFMRTRVDYLLTDWSRKFQAKPPPAPQPEQAKPAEKGENKNDMKVEVKQEKSDNEVAGDAQAIKPPPEKRQRLG